MARPELSTLWLVRCIPGQVIWISPLVFAKTLVQMLGGALPPQNHTARPPAPVFPSWRVSLTLEAQSIRVRGLTPEASSRAKKCSGQDLTPWQKLHAPFPVAHTSKIKTFSSASIFLGREKQFQNAGDDSNSFPVRVSFLFPLHYPSSQILRGKFQLFPSSL